MVGGRVLRSRDLQQKILHLQRPVSVAGDDIATGILAGFINENGSVNHCCIGCYNCMQTVCPQDALQVRASDGKVVVNQETCFGCGYCKQACPTGAIRILQTMPMCANVHEYFLKEARLDLAVDGYPGAGTTE